MSQNVSKCPIENQSDDEKWDIDAPESDLTDRQRTAIEMMLTGKTDVAIAESLGVSRKTIYRWRTQDEQFRAHLTRRRAEMYDATLDRFRTMLSAALDVLDKHVHDRYAPTALRAARTLLYMARIGESATDFSSLSAVSTKASEPRTSDGIMASAQRLKPSGDEE